jgi:hypothetical protein
MNGTRLSLLEVCFFTPLELSMRPSKGTVHMPGGHLSLSGQIAVRDRPTVEASDYTWLVRTCLPGVHFPDPKRTGRLLGSMDTPLGDL